MERGVVRVGGPRRRPNTGGVIEGCTRSKVVLTMNDREKRLVLCLVPRDGTNKRLLRVHDDCQGQ